jgi:hypothetical protein
MIVLQSWLKAADMSSRQDLLLWSAWAFVGFAMMVRGIANRRKKR